MTDLGLMEFLIVFWYATNVVKWIMVQNTISLTKIGI